MQNELTKPEQGELARCEHIIDCGISTFFDVGNALSEIRDKNLYRASHSDFQAYCDNKWGFTPAQKTYLIGEDYSERKKEVGAPVDNKNAQNGGNNDEKQLDHNDLIVSAAEEIAEETGVSVPTVKRAETYKDAIKRIRSVNSKAADDILSGSLSVPKKDVIQIGKQSDSEIGQSLKNLRQGLPWDGEKPVPEPEKVPVDKNGNPLPKKTLSAFAALEEFTSIKSRISTLKGDIAKLAETEAGAFIRWNPIKIDLENVYRSIRFSAPYCVCPYCKGKKKDCKACGGMGWGGETLYKNAPEEMK